MSLKEHKLDTRQETKKNCNWFQTMILKFSILIQKSTNIRKLSISLYFIFKVVITTNKQGVVGKSKK